MPDRISLVRWRDAKTDPAPVSVVVWTDRGLGFFGAADHMWWHLDWDKHMDPQPSVWCRPFPPGDDAPKADDLRSVLGYVEEMLAQVGPIRDENVVAFRRQVARLRRAIEEAER